MSNLKSGLEFFIAEVEAKEYDILFSMLYYTSCVIGSTVGWKSPNSCLSTDERYVLKKYFGIEKEYQFECYFSKCSYKFYTDEQWKVIQLFTNAIGSKVYKKDWLEMAKKVLKELN